MDSIALDSYKVLVYYPDMHSVMHCTNMMIMAKRSKVEAGFYFIWFVEREGLGQS